MPNGDPKKYKTPSGVVVTEQEIRDKYGDRADKIMSNFQLITDEPSVAESTPEIFLTPNGKEVTKEQLQEKYGDRWESVVEFVKKKDTTDSVSADGGLELRDTRDPDYTILEEPIEYINVPEENKLYPEGVKYVRTPNPEYPQQLEAYERQLKDQKYTSGLIDQERIDLENSIPTLEGPARTRAIRQIYDTDEATYDAEQQAIKDADAWAKEQGQDYIPKDTREQRYQERKPEARLVETPVGLTSGELPLTDDQRELNELDRKYTEYLKSQEDAEYSAKRLQREAERKKEQEESLQRRRAELQKEEGFVKDIAAVTAEDMDLTEEAGQKRLNDLYGKYGFLFEQIGVGDALLVTAEDGSTQEIDLQPFGVPIIGKTLKATKKDLQKFISDHAMPAIEPVAETAEEMSFLDKAYKANIIRGVGMKNEDGSSSTHLMAAEVIDGKWVAFPTLFPITEKIDEGGAGVYVPVPYEATSSPNDWMQFGDTQEERDAAYKEALKRGEVFEFDTKEEALAFGEGSWKNADIAEYGLYKFMKDNGVDGEVYLNRYREYNAAHDELEFIESDPPLRVGYLSEEDQEKYGEKYYGKDGKLRNDYKDFIPEIEKEISEGRSVVTDEQFMDLRGDYDAQTEKLRLKASVESSNLNKEVNLRLESLNEKSVEMFDVPLGEILDIVPTTQEEVDLINSIIDESQSLLSVQRQAATKYELAQTFVSSKFNPDASANLLDNTEAFANALETGWKRGQALDEIMLGALGIDDLSDDATRAEKAAALVKYLEEADTGKTARQMENYNTARGFIDTMLLFLKNPAEMSTTVVVESVMQMAPHGLKAAPVLVGTGVGVGALAGGPAGAIYGGGKGLQTTMAYLGFIMEYGNAAIDAMVNQGYDITDPMSVDKALQDEKVWDEAWEVGGSRGAVIGGLSFLSGLGAGEFMKGAGLFVPRIKAVGLGVFETFAYDPITEGGIELIAQVAAGQDIDFKEVGLESMGGIASNTALRAYNLTADSVMRDRRDMALKLASLGELAEADDRSLPTTEGTEQLSDPAPTNHRGPISRMMTRKLPPILSNKYFDVSDKDISRFGNKLEKQGKLTPEENQKLQENVGLRRAAIDILGASSNKNNLSEVFHLLAEKKWIESNDNRKGANGPRIKIIDDSIQFIANESDQNGGKKVVSPFGKTEEQYQKELAEERARQQKADGPMLWDMNFLYKREFDSEESIPSELRELESVERVVGDDGKITLSFTGQQLSDANIAKTEDYAVEKPSTEEKEVTTKPKDTKRIFSRAKNFIAKNLGLIKAEDTPVQKKLNSVLQEMDEELEDLKETVEFYTARQEKGIEGSSEAISKAYQDMKDLLSLYGDRLKRIKEGTEVELETNLTLNPYIKNWVGRILKSKEGVIFSDKVEAQDSTAESIWNTYKENIEKLNTEEEAAREKNDTASVKAIEKQMDELTEKLYNDVQGTRVDDTTAEAEVEVEGEEVATKKIESEKRKIDDQVYATFEQFVNTDGTPRSKGTVTLYDSEGNEVGFADYSRDKDGKLRASVDVNPEFQRKGYATEMYIMIEEKTGEVIYPSSLEMQSNEARALWEQPNRPFGPQEEVALDVTEEDLSEVVTQDDIEALRNEINRKKDEGSISDNIGMKAYLDGKEGMIKVDDVNENTLVFETNDEIIELGNKDEVGDNLIAESGISVMPPEGVDVVEEGRPLDVITIDNVDYTIIGRSRDKKGKAVVKVKEVESGLVRRLKGEKAERILKDDALRKPSTKPAISLQEEGKEVDAEKKKKDAREDRKKKKAEFEGKTLQELKDLEAKAQEALDKYEQELLDEAAKKSDAYNIVEVGDNVFRVSKKKTSGKTTTSDQYTVSQMKEDGKFVPIKDEKKRKQAIDQFKKEQDKSDAKALEDIKESVDEVKKQEEDKILDFLDKAIEATSGKGKLYDASLGVPMALLNTSLKAVKLAYKGGKTLAQAIQAGIDHISSQGYSPNKLAYQEFVLSNLEGKSEQALAEGKQELENIKEGKTATTKPAKIYRGTGGKPRKKPVHKGVKGVFSSTEETAASRFVGEDGELVEVIIPEGTTVEVIELDPTGIPASKMGDFRAQETEAINNSDADVVKLVTIDSPSFGKGPEVQYIIKNPDLIGDQKADTPVNTDIETEEKVREERKKEGIKEKRPPSIAKILGKIKDVKKITISEKVLLRNRLKALNEGAKNVLDAQKKAKAELTAEIKELVSSGKVTTKQLLSVINRFAKVNLLSDASIDSFVDYMAKVFADAEYAEKMEKANKLRARAKKNVKTKIGVADAIADQLNQVFSIKPTFIPDSVLDKYLELLDMFGQSKEILSPKDIESVNEMVQDILRVMDEEHSMVDALSEKFDNYDGVVVKEDGSIDYSATVKKMQDEGLIDEGEAVVMRKYKNDINPKEPKVELTEEEIQEQKDDLIEGISKATQDSSIFPSVDERKLAERFYNLVNDIKNLAGLPVKDLERIQALLETMENGYLPHFVDVMVNKMEGKNDGNVLSEALKDAKLGPVENVYSKLKAIGKDAIAATRKAIERNPLAYIDRVFGNFKTKPIFDSIFKKSSKAYESYVIDLRKITDRIAKAERAVIKSFNRNPNKILLSKFKQQVYLIQKEYESNKGNKEVNPAHKSLEATIFAIRNGEVELYSDKDADLLQQILDEFTNEDTGEVDINQLYKSFNAAEKASIKAVQEANESLQEKAVYTAGVIRGQRISPRDNYVHLNVLRGKKGSPTSLIEDFKNRVQGSTKSQVLQERSGGVSPLNFDVYASAIRGGKSVLMDYHLTDPIRQAYTALAQAKENLKNKKGVIPKDKRDIVTAIEDSYNQVIDNILNTAHQESTIVNDVANYIKKQGYRAVLASAPRVVAELTSNLSFVFAASPVDYTKGIKALSTAKKSGSPVDIMSNLNSSNTNRLYPEGLSGRLVDQGVIDDKQGVSGGKARSEFVNRLLQSYETTLSPVSKVVGKIADALISTPDKMVMRPMWFGSFQSKFKELTGTDPDFKKIQENDEAYMRDNKEALDAATTFADEMSVMTGSTTNPFMGLLKTATKSDASTYQKIFDNFNNYMTTFLIFEYHTAVNGIMNAVGKGELGRAKGIQLLAATTSRMVLYLFIGQILRQEIFGDEDDEELSTEDLLKKSFVSATSSLIFGRGFGQATRAVINVGLEKTNEAYFDFLRDGEEYDYYRDAIAYTILPMDADSRGSDVGDVLKQATGPFGSMVKTGDLAIRKLTQTPPTEEEAVERRNKEIAQRLPLEIAGNLGFVPFYNDVRKMVLKNLYKDLRKSEKFKKEKKAYKEKYIKEFGDEGKDYDGNPLTVSSAKKFDKKTWDEFFGKDSEWEEKYNIKDEDE